MKISLILLLATLILPPARADTNVLLGAFSTHNLQGWQHKIFNGETRYQLKSVDGLTVLTADSHAAGSGLFKTQSIDLTQTPILNWSWRISNRLTGLNEQSQNGDDFAARIYVVVKGGLAFWQTQSINYVWAGNSAKDRVWPNAFAGEQTMMLALRGPEAPLNTWQQEKRNVRSDLKQLFGEDFSRIDAIALMTDTDNSNGRVSATYGDIWFSKD